MRKDFKAGQTLLVSYTNSKLISNALDTFNSSMDTSGVPGIQNYYDLKSEESLASFDNPQRLVVGYVLDLPFGRGKKYLGSDRGVVDRLIGGWGADGILTFQKGFPLGLTTSSNLTQSYGGGSRPNFNASACPNGAALDGSAESRINKWFNTACYSQPAAYTFGNVSRTLPNVRSDGINNWDFALFKDNTFGAERRFNLQFRAEFFNLFNHPQFDVPGQSYGTAQFGVVSLQFNNPRLVQLALKLTF